jgi:hypothetical protein
MAIQRGVSRCKSLDVFNKHNFSFEDTFSLAPGREHVNAITLTSNQCQIMNQQRAVTGIIADQQLALSRPARTQPLSFVANRCTDLKRTV